MAEEPATPASLVRVLQAFDAVPAVPSVSVQLMATAPGNEHLLKLMTESVDRPDRFAGKRIAFVATHGAEEAEILIPRKWLEDRGAVVDIVSPREVDPPITFGARVPDVARNHILLIRFMENSGWLRIDRSIEEVGPDDYDAVIIPGGAWNPDQLRLNQSVLSFVRAFHATGKPLAAICHAPVVLVSAQLLRGRRATSYWSVREDLVNAGAIVSEAPVVVDESIITGRFIFDIPQFLEAIVQQLERRSATSTEKAT